MKVASQSLPALVDSLVALTPGTPAAEQSRHAMESLLMNALKGGGREAGEKMVESLVAHGYALERLDALPCMWRVPVSTPRVLEIWFTGGDPPVVAAVSYRAGKPWGSKAQQRAAKLQAEFYRRYELLALRDGALPPDDRLIQLVGEFEADVNNGGFGQYLGNKGAARARAALECLSAIGARRTARWLTSALEGRVNSLNQGKFILGSAGTQTAALAFGGQTTPGFATTGQTESWNGTAWTEVNDLNTSRTDIVGASGTNTVGLAFGGAETFPVSSTEEWSGPAVQTVNITTS